jgi:hypothetical protein
MYTQIIEMHLHCEIQLPNLSFVLEDGMVNRGTHLFSSYFVKYSPYRKLIWCIGCISEWILCCKQSRFSIHNRAYVLFCITWTLSINRQQNKHYVWILFKVHKKRYPVTPIGLPELINSRVLKTAWEAERCVVAPNMILLRALFTYQTKFVNLARPISEFLLCIKMPGDCIGESLFRRLWTSVSYETLQSLCFLLIVK